MVARVYQCHTTTLFDDNSQPTHFVLWPAFQPFSSKQDPLIRVTTSNGKNWKLDHSFEKTVQNWSKTAFSRFQLCISKSKVSHCMKNLRGSNNGVGSYTEGTNKWASSKRIITLCCWTQKTKHEPIYFAVWLTRKRRRAINSTWPKITEKLCNVTTKLSVSSTNELYTNFKAKNHQLSRPSSYSSLASQQFSSFFQSSKNSNFRQNFHN